MPLVAVVSVSMRLMWLAEDLQELLEAAAWCHNGVFHAQR
jgi:hypothetical protein